MGPLSPQQQIVFDMLCVCAEEGRVCPSNSELAIALHLLSIGRCSSIVSSLERCGLIAVDRGNNTRVITIVATGQCTAGKITLKHWRERPENAARCLYSRESHGVQTTSHEQAKRALPRVHRDPCPYCGVRGDVGCVHQGRKAFEVLSLAEVAA